MDNAASPSVTQMLQGISAGDPEAAAKVFPVVYEELRQLARFHLARTPPGQTLQPTALVHEAFFKLFGPNDPGWDSRGHFFSAAARAMREILVDHARRKGAVKRGGDRQRAEFDLSNISIDTPVEDLLALDEALKRLEEDDPRKVQVVMLRCFVGLDRDDIARLLGVTSRTVDRDWRYIVARLHRDLYPDEQTRPNL